MLQWLASRFGFEQTEARHLLAVEVKWGTGTEDSLRAKEVLVEILTRLQLPCECYNLRLPLSSDEWWFFLGVSDRLIERLAISAMDVLNALDGQEEIAVQFGSVCLCQGM
jgi:hypothetical protein